MPNAIRVIVQDYGWIHLSIGLLGDTLFFSGSILFLPAFEQLRPVPIWMFTRLASPPPHTAATASSASAGRSAATR